MNKLFKTFAKHFGREDAITIVNGVNSNSNKGGDDDNQVKIVSVEYANNSYSATVTLNKQVNHNDILKHLKLFVSSEHDFQGRHYVLEYVAIYNNIVYMSDNNEVDVSLYKYEIILNSNEILIEDTTANHGPILSTICWL